MIIAKPAAGGKRGGRKSQDGRALLAVPEAPVAGRSADGAVIAAGGDRLPVQGVGGERLEEPVDGAVDGGVVPAAEVDVPQTVQIGVAALVVAPVDPAIGLFLTNDGREDGVVELAVVVEAATGAHVIELRPGEREGGGVIEPAVAPGAGIQWISNGVARAAVDLHLAQIA